MARLAPALLAVMATLLLGAVASSQTGAWRWFESTTLLPLIGVVFAAAAGLLACHLAQLSASPAPSMGALAAGLTAAALPGLSVVGLLIPLAIGAYAAVRRPRLRFVAAIGLAGVATAGAAAWLNSPIAHLAGSLIMLAGAALQVWHAASPAANDNRGDGASSGFWSLPDGSSCATQPARTPSLVSGE